MSHDHLDVEYDVIVVGGGPIGAAVTGDLGRRGLRVLMLEQGDGMIADARMHAVNIRSMEVLRSFGLEQRLRNSGFPLDHPQDVVFVTSFTGEEIARIKWPSLGDMRPPEFSPVVAWRCPQAWFNPIMLEFAAAQPSTTLNFFWRFEGFEQDERGVTVEATEFETGIRHRIRGKYLVGCDGPRGEIRSLMSGERVGTEAFGQSAECIFRSPDLKHLTRMGRVGRYIFVSEAGLSATLMAFDGHDRYRFALMIQPTHLDEEGMKAEIRKLADVPFSFELVSPILHWTNRNVLSEYVKGRVVLAGDAAHGMPPTGGFGMNVGFMDTYALCWRLEALIKGWGGPRLLETYNLEQQAAVRRISGMAAEIYKDWVYWNPRLKEMGAALSAKTPEGAALRKEVGAELLATFAREFNKPGGPLGNRFRESPGCIPDGTPEPDDSLVDYKQTARPGHRAPHAWLAPNQSTLDLFGREFVLFDFSRSVASGTQTFEAEAQRRHIPLKSYKIDDGSVAALYERKYVLVRPDGMVAWRSDDLPENPGDILLILSGQKTAAALAAL